jgi:glyoxylase-like metal-dependent hydrolase (beta-lactamase superfamily II)
MAPQLTQIADGVHRLGVRMSGLFILLDDAVTLVDSGPRWSGSQIASALQQLGRSIEEVDRVIVTHGHFDHFGSVASVVRRSDAEVHVHATDAGIIAGRERSTVPLPQPLRFIFGRRLAG